jgi:hypothetical protein
LLRFVFHHRDLSFTLFVSCSSDPVRRRCVCPRCDS